MARRGSPRDAWAAPRLPRALPSPRRSPISRAMARCCSQSARGRGGPPRAAQEGIAALLVERVGPPQDLQVVGGVPSLRGGGFFAAEPTAGEEAGEVVQPVAPGLPLDQARRHQLAHRGARAVALPLPHRRGGLEVERPWEDGEPAPEPPRLLAEELEADRE